MVGSRSALPHVLLPAYAPRIPTLEIRPPITTSSMSAMSGGGGSNLTDDLEAVNASISSPSGLSISIGVGLTVIIITTLVGNSLVIASVAMYRRLRTVTNYFVVSLAIADITVAMLVMPCGVIYEIYGRWQFGWIFCYFWISCDVTCCTASILHLCLISLDRYWAITTPFSYKNRMSKRRAIASIICVWICSVAISFLPIYTGIFADTSMMKLYTDSDQCGLYVNKPYAVVSATTSFYAPLIVMLFAYWRIFRIAQKQATEIQKLENSVMSNAPNRYNVRLRKRSRRLSKDTKAIKTLGTLMGLFCISWVPFFLMYIILPFCPDCWMPPMLVSAITWLGWVNSAINPCVYAFTSHDFRNAFHNIISCNRTACCWKNDRKRGIYSRSSYKDQCGGFVEAPVVLMAEFSPRSNSCGVQTRVLSIKKNGKTFNLAPPTQSSSSEGDSLH